MYIFTLYHKRLVKKTMKETPPPYSPIAGHLFVYIIKGNI